MLWENLILYEAFQVKVKVILRLTVSWPVCLGIRPPSGIRDQLFFLFLGNYHEIFAVVLNKGRPL
jgi:hypothetical protein